MLKFYYQNTDQFTEWVIDKLEEMVVARKIVKVEKEPSLPPSTDRSELPVLCDEHDIWKSNEEIRAFLEEMHERLALGRSMQSDTCHIDPENPGDCL